VAGAVFFVLFTAWPRERDREREGERVMRGGGDGGV
jgi:hypothetical protein